MGQSPLIWERKLLERKHDPCLSSSPSCKLSSKLFFSLNTLVKKWKPTQNEPRKEMQESINVGKRENRHRSPPSRACRASLSSKLALGPSVHGTRRQAANTPTLLQMGVQDDSGLPPTSQLLLRNLPGLGPPSSTSLLQKPVHCSPAQRAWNVPLDGWLGRGSPMRFPRRCLHSWRRRGALWKDVPYAFTINHHCCQQALLLAAQPVMGLALLVPEAGQALGAGKVLTDSMLHTGSQAVRAPRTRPRRKERSVLTRQCYGYSRGAQFFCLFPPPFARWEEVWPSFQSNLPLLFHIISQQSQSHADGMFKWAVRKMHPRTVNQGHLEIEYGISSARSTNWVFHLNLKLGHL